MTPISVNLSLLTYPSDNSNIAIKASFKNEAKSTCYEVPGYLLMEDDNPHGNLQISNKLTGKEPEYLGPQIKIKPSYVAIQPGETKDFEVSLQDYDLRKGETYNVKYLSSLTYYECGRLSSPHSGFAESNVIDIKV